MLRLPLVTELLTGFAPLDLVPQFLGDFQPGGLKSMVAGFGVNVGAGHSQMHLRPKGRSTVPLSFKHHLSGGDGYKMAQALEL
jgi:hypothetical protein